MLDCSKHGLCTVLISAVFRSSGRVHLERNLGMRLQQLGGADRAIRCCAPSYHISLVTARKNIPTEGLLSTDDLIHRGTALSTWIHKTRLVHLPKRRATQLLHKSPSNPNAQRSFWGSMS